MRSDLKRNIAANIAGGVLIGVMTLIITPIQVRVLGIEAYGVIGFIATLQVVTGALDLGLSSTLTRELAGDTSEGRRDSFALLGTATTVFWALSFAIWAALSVASGSIARSWFTIGRIPADEVEQGLRFVALFVALRWPVALYSGVLAGAHRMDVLNVVKTASAAVRLLGGIGVILLWPDLSTFLAWVAISAVGEVLAFMVVTRKVIPEWDMRPRFSMEAVQKVWRFSLGMMGLGISSALLPQVDRLIVSKMLPLEDFGYYSLAHTAATAVSLAVTACSSAMMPSFAVAHAAGDRTALQHEYTVMSRLMIFGAGAVFFLFVFFGKPVLTVWVTEETAERAWLACTLISGGYWLSSGVSAAYTFAIASREPLLPLKISTASVVLYIPALAVLTHLWGIEGAATAWLMLFGGYVLVVIPMIHRRLVGMDTMPWYLRGFIVAAMLGWITFGGLRLISNVWGPFPPLIYVAFAAGAGLLYAVLSLAVMGSEVRRALYWRRVSVT